LEICQIAEVMNGEVMESTTLFPQKMTKLPKSGKMIRGEIYQTPTWVRRTSGKESGLWRTPDTGQGGSSGLLKKGITKRQNGQSVQVRLCNQVLNPKMWPTPRAGNPGSRPNGKGGKVLAEEVKKETWPTPSCMDIYTDKMKSSQQMEGSLHSVTLAQKVKWPTPQDRDYRSHKRVNSKSDYYMLNEEVQKFPTPTTTDYRTGYGDTEAGRKRLEHPRGKPLRDVATPGGNLNSQFVEWLMNYPKDWTNLNKKIELTFNIPLSKLVSDKFNLGENNGKAEETRSRKILSILQQKTSSKYISDENRGYDNIQETEILQSKVHGKGNDTRECRNFRSKDKGKEVKREEMPELRNDRKFTSSSQRLKPMEQQFEQHSDIMCNLSHEMALETRQKQIKEKEKFSVQDLWQACTEIGYVPTSLSEIPKIWESLNDEEKDWIALRISKRDVWHSEWPGTSRLSTGTKDRVNQLKGLGNAIVPQIAKLLFEQIKPLL